MRASRASVRASCRSSFRLLLVINCTFCACATITSCPSSVNSRLTHGECVPVSSAMRLCGILENVCFIASGVVGNFCSRMILPASKKIGTVQAYGKEILKEQKLTIGVDLRDRSSFYCVLDVCEL